MTILTSCGIDLVAVTRHASEFATREPHWLSKMPFPE